MTAFTVNARGVVQDIQRPFVITAFLVAATGGLMLRLFLFISRSAVD